MQGSKASWQYCVTLLSRKNRKVADSFYLTWQGAVKYGTHSSGGAIFPNAAKKIGVPQYSAALLNSPNEKVEWDLHISCLIIQKYLCSLSYGKPHSNSLVGYSLYGLRPRITHLHQRCDRAEPTERVFSLALLIFVDGHFVNFGVDRSRSHPKGKGYLTATSRYAFLQAEKQCWFFVSIFLISFPGRLQSTVIISCLKRQKGMGHLLDCNFNYLSPLPVGKHFQNLSLQFLQCFWVFWVEVRVFEKIQLSVKFPFFNVVVVLHKGYLLCSKKIVQGKVYASNL